LSHRTIQIAIANEAKQSTEPHAERRIASSLLRARAMAMLRNMVRMTGDDDGPADHAIGCLPRRDESIECTVTVIPPVSGRSICSRTRWPAVVPGAVTGEKDAVDAAGKRVMQAVDYSKLVPLLWAALQKLVAKVAAIEARAS
jgi:hypothetical protein